MSDTDLARFRAAVAGGLAHLESRRQEVNDLNVFPVADGDTGDNMALTLKAVLAELDRLHERYGDRPIDEIGRTQIVESVARAALLGARGNSGVILSQLIRGAAEELASRPGELVDATLVAAAIANAADKAYASVREPAEGTILTVAREMARMISSDVAHASGEMRLKADTPPEVQDEVIANTLERGVIAGQEAVKRGPQMLAALREAGVVDAGGYALTVLVAGVIAALRGEDPPDLDHHAPARISHPQHSSTTFRYCTNFAVTGEHLDPGGFIAPLEEVGDSVLVVGDSRTLKIHVHTDEPDRAAALFEGVGEVSRFDVADMQLQIEEREQRIEAAAGGGLTAAAEKRTNACAGGAAGGAGEGGLLTRAPSGGAGAAPLSDGAGPGPFSGAAGAREAEGGAGVRPASQRMRCGVLAVANGPGISRLLRELGAHVIDGGPTLNPSTYQLLAGIHQVSAEEVVVLPGSRNVLMAAERAAALSDKQVCVVPSLSQQVSLAAAVALRPHQSVEVNAAAMEEVIASLRTGAVAPAARGDVNGRFEKGEAVGFLGDEILSWGDPSQTLLRVLSALSAEAELVSVLSGAQAPLTLQEIAELVDGTLTAELELREGGQPAYWWLLSAE